MKINLYKPYQEVLLICVILIISFNIFSHFDVLEMVVEFSSKYEEYEIDEIVSTMIVFTFCMLIFSIRRLKEVSNSKKKTLEMNNELKEAINEIQTLRGVIPICSYCHNIRDDDGAWGRLEQYISAHSDAKFSHGICPKCLPKARADAGLGNNNE